MFLIRVPSDSVSIHKSFVDQTVFVSVLPISPPCLSQVCQTIGSVKVSSGYGTPEVTGKERRPKVGVRIWTGDLRGWTYRDCEVREEQVISLRCRGGGCVGGRADDIRVKISMFLNVLDLRCSIGTKCGEEGC